ncbi:sulfatase [bacterium]|nr:sulfatase [bacterium]RQV95283.1 MAG: DUF4976 domain-containing protein [bacterium]
MKTTRRQFIKSVGLGTVTLAFPNLISTRCAAAKQPNILFIMSDDHAEQAISCYGSQLIETSHIDRIAHEGIRFENSFVTNSICAPSRAVLLTGKYSHMNGLRDNQDEFDGSQMTFPKLLQQAGYQTAMIGKWHLKTDPTGFDEWKILIDQGEYYNPTLIENGVRNEYIGYTTDLITDIAVESLNRRDRNRPFCMLVHHKAPHRNWMPNLKYLDVYNDRDLPLPETFYDDYADRQAAKEADMRIDDMYLSSDMKLNTGYYEKETGTGGNLASAPFAEMGWAASLARLTETQRKAWDAHYDRINEEFRDLKLTGDDLLRWKYQRYIKDYLSCILSVDESVGRLLEYLDEEGLNDNTLVVYTSDQGFYLGEHGWYDKRFMYEESLGMPLVMRYPDQMKSNRVSEKMVLNLDFAPTFLDFAGVEIPVEMQGESLRAITSGNGQGEWRDSIYYHYYEYPHGWHNVKRHYGVRTERYKLIHFYYDIDTWELFDLQRDPNELNNLYDDPDYTDIVNTLKTELERLQQKYGDTDIRI